MAGGFPVSAQEGNTGEPDVDSHYNRTCISADCHPVPVSGTIPRHIPYLEGRCTVCHLDHSAAQPLLLKEKGPAMCLQCHAETEMMDSSTELVHPPVQEVCTDCHAPHESRVRNLLREVSDLHACAECHADFLEASRQMPFRHRFFDPETECGSCHYAHRSMDGKYLRENLTESCLTCHDLPIQVEGRVLENLARELREAPYVHEAMKEKSCAVCHTPHGARQSSLLRTGYPAGKYEAYDPQQYALCWQCHDSALVEDVKGVGVTQFRNGETNLHRVHVADLRQGRACHICHAPHAAENRHLLRTQIRFKNWVAPLEMHVSADGGSCRTPCHQERAYHRGIPAGASEESPVRP
jgi:predicted CXXCH cytochrome family protein